MLLSIPASLLGSVIHNNIMGHFQCEFCEKSYGKKANLKRHYNNDHEGVIPDSFNELQNRKYECKGCKVMVANPTTHANYCPATKKNRVGEKTQSTASLVSQAVADAASRAADQPEPAVAEPSPVKTRRLNSTILPEDMDIIKDFLKWGVEDNQRAESSMAKYVDQVKSYLRHCYAEDSSFSLASQLSCYLDHELTVKPKGLPHISSWFTSITKIDARGLAVNGFIKLVDYFIHRLDEIGPSPEMLSLYMPLLERARRNAEKWNRTTNKRIQEKNAIQARDKVSVITQEELLEYKARYDNSEERKRHFDVLRDMENATKTLSPAQIRDFLAFEVYLSSGGLRPDVVRNMTIYELSKPRKVSAEGVDEKLAIEVAKHKTARTYGPAPVIMDPRLYSLVLNYVKVVWPQITGKESSADQHSQLVFCRQSGKCLDRLSGDNFVRWANVEKELRVYEFRKMYSSQAWKNLDRDTAAKVTRIHGHSEEIRDRHYAKRDLQLAEWAVNHKAIGGEDGDKHLPSADEGDSSEDEFTASFRRQYEADKEEQERRDIAGKSHVDTPRQAFSSEEKAIILKAFDGYSKGNISLQVYNNALVNHRAFSRLVTDHLQLPSRWYRNQNKSAEEVRKQVGNSWRADWRKKH